MVGSTPNEYVFLIPQAMLIIVIVSGVCVCVCAANLVVVVAELVTCRATFWTHGKSCRQALSLSTAAAVAVALRDWLRAGTNIHIQTHFMYS